MEITARDPLKGRLITVDVEFTDDNTTWYDDCENDDDIYRITDIEGNLLISAFGYTYPVLIQCMSRADIGYDRKKALELLCMYTE